MTGTSCPVQESCILRGDQHDDWRHRDAGGNEWPVKANEAHTCLSRTRYEDDPDVVRDALLELCDDADRAGRGVAPDAVRALLGIVKATS